MVHQHFMQKGLGYNFAKYGKPNKFLAGFEDNFIIQKMKEEFLLSWQACRQDPRGGRATIFSGWAIMLGIYTVCKIKG